MAVQFCFGEDYQGYPGRLHGCFAAGLLDEVIGRAIRTHYSEEASGKYFNLIGDSRIRFRGAKL